MFCTVFAQNFLDRKTGDFELQSCSDDLPVLLQMNSVKQRVATLRSYLAHTRNSPRSTYRRGFTISCHREIHRVGTRRKVWWIVLSNYENTALVLVVCVRDLLVNEFNNCHERDSGHI